MKRLSAILLAVALLLSIFTFTAVAEGDPVSLEIMVKRNAAVNVAAEENKAWAFLADKFGVEFTFIDIDSGSWNEKFNLMLTSGEYPDIITKTSLTKVTTRENLDAGAFVDLAQYKDYLPNYFALITSDEALSQLAFYEDGSVGGFAQQANVATTETNLLPTNLAMIYQPWLDAVGMEMPNTTEELYNVLKAFKEQDPNGNGAADEIPLCPLYGQGSLYLLANMFGLPFDSSANYCDIKDGQVYFLASTDNYKEYLKYFNRLWNEELLDHEVFTQNQQQVVAKGTDTDPLIGMSVASGAALVVGSDRAWDMAAMPMVHSEFSEPMWTRRVAGYVYTGVITTQCENIEKACEVMDYFYTREGASLAWRGIEGESYQVNEDGSWNFIFSDEYTDATSLRAAYTLQPGGGLAAAYPIDWLDINDSDEQWFITNNGKMALEQTEFFAERYPDVVYDTRDQKELDTIANDIKSYVDQTMAQFITGEKDIDAEWDNYLNTLKQMRLDDMLAIMQGQIG